VFRKFDLFRHRMYKRERIALSWVRCTELVSIIGLPLSKGSNLIPTLPLFYICWQKQIQLQKHRIVTYEGLSWRIVMGSGFYGWIYWYLDYNYSQLQQLTIKDTKIIGLRVSSLSPWRMPNEESLPNEFCWAFSRVLLFITSWEPNRGLHLEQLLFWCVVSVAT
jgi:hypothetical protein